MSEINLQKQEDIEHFFNQACQFHQSGNLEQAQAMYLELLSNLDSPLVRYNLGLVYYEKQDYIKALNSFEQVVSAVPDDPDARFNLALSQKQCGQLDHAITNYEVITLQQPDNIDALYNLAGCHRESHDYHKAIDVYLATLDLAPNHQSAMNNLAFTYQRCGKRKEAIHWYEKLIEFDPSHESAQHMLSALKGETPDTSPVSYVKEVFDNYSANYDTSLVKELKYTVPEQLLALLKQNDNLPKYYSLGLDLGCGTGLSGVIFRSIIEDFDGVDLSEKMIELAREKQIYDSLSCKDILNFLSDSSKVYDIIIAADVLTYLGDLHPLFNSLANTINQNSLFLFSTEKNEQDNYVIRPTGRFAHAEGYIQSLIAEHGWQLLNCIETNLRKERDKWIRGNLWLVQQ